MGKIVAIVNPNSAEEPIGELVRYDGIERLVTIRKASGYLFRDFGQIREATQEEISQYEAEIKKQILEDYGV